MENIGHANDSRLFVVLMCTCYQDGFVKTILDEENKNKKHVIILYLDGIFTKN